MFVAIGAFTFVSLTPGALYAHEGDEQGQEPVAQAENTDQDQGQAASPYKYTAQPGDSYSEIARKAVQTYGFNKNVSLSNAQIVAAETFLTLEAGSPHLSVGQTVEISEASVKAAVEKAQALDQASLARWDKYTVNVDFNTNNVGESHS